MLHVMLRGGKLRQKLVDNDCILSMYLALMIVTLRRRERKYSRVTPQ